MTQNFKSWLALALAVVMPILCACGKDQPKEKPQPDPQAEYDEQFAIGEFPYLKIGDVKGADAFEKKLGKRTLQNVNKLGNIYWGTEATYFKGTKYSDKVSAAILEIPVIKVDGALVAMMAGAGFKDYGVGMIQDAQGNVAPCRVFWNKDLKIEASMYDVKLSALKSAKAVMEFVPRDTEPEMHQEEPQPEPSAILTDTKDFPLTDLLGVEQTSLPREKIIANEALIGLRTLDEEASSDDTLYFLTDKSQEKKSNLKAAMYFYDPADKMISLISLDCKAVTTAEDLQRPELKAWFATNGYTFEKERNSAKGPGLQFRHSGTGVVAYIYLKTSNNVCFIELSK